MSKHTLTVRCWNPEEGDSEKEATASHYGCEGDVRGRCPHNHRTLSGALRCLASDQSGCARQGGYSDRGVYAYYTDPEYPHSEEKVASWLQEGEEPDQGTWEA